MAGYSQYGGNPYGSGSNEYGSSNPYGDGGYGSSNPYAGGDQHNVSAASSQPATRYQTNSSSVYPQTPHYSQTQGSAAAPQPQSMPAQPAQYAAQGQQYAQGPNGSQSQLYAPQGAAPGGQGQPGQQQAAFSRSTPALSNSDFLARVEVIKADLNKLGQNVSEISTIHQKMVNSPDSSSTAQLEHLTAQTQILNTQIKDKIRFLKADQLKSGQNATKDSQVRSLEQTFKQRLEDYRQEEKHYSDRYKEQIGRQYRIVNPDASDAEVREAVQADWGNEGVFQTALSANRSGAANSVLGSVRARHNDIQKIERTIMELNTLFEQLAEQVVLQDAAVQRTFEQTEVVKQDLSTGNKQLGKGVDSARRARKLKWWCFFICLAIIIVIGLAVGLYFGLHKASSSTS